MNAIGVGRVDRTIGELLLARLPAARVGDGVRIFPSTRAPMPGIVAGVSREAVAIAPFAGVAGIKVGDRVECDESALSCVLGFGALGRTIDGLGTALDGRGALAGELANVTGMSIALAERAPIDRPLWTGIRAIDGLLTIGRGARFGLFGAAGTGKSTLLELIAQGSTADAVIVALVGERGREAAAWMARKYRRMTVVCATSDRPAAERIRAAQTALAQAMTLRDRGLRVLFIFDSLARYASALREQRIPLGEPVGRGGFPPSVFAELARLLEGAGSTSKGSITMLATVLSEDTDGRDPISEAARSLLDGHVVLSRERAAAGRFPAIDPLASTSRTMPAVAEPEHSAAAAVVRQAIAVLLETKDARELGLLKAPSAATLRALEAETAIEAFLLQTSPSPPHDTLRALRAIAGLLQPVDITT